MEQESISMEVVNSQAAGIDVGSRSHWVAVGQSEQDVREYGVFNEDLFTMADWLKEKKVTTIAMESTGTYWQNLYAVLISKGFHVILCRALQSNGRKDYLFTLQQELETYDHLQNKIEQCDKEIEKMLDEIINSDDDKRQHHLEPKPHKRVNKNTPKDIDLNLKSYQMFEGTDLLAIEGMSYSTVLSLMSEVGIEGIRKFSSAKHFASWLRLAPNNKVSGGRVLSIKVPKGSNRLKIALRNAANAIGNLKESTPLRDFFHRINFRKGRVSAISATARKLAVIIWNMVVKRVAYVNPEGYLFLDQKRKMGLVKRIKKQIDKFGLTTEELGIATC